MFKKKYLLLELDSFEAEFYHLPEFVPYFEKDQKKLESEGFSWQLALKAMKNLLKDEPCDEYKAYKLYIRKWDHYQRLTVAIDTQNWLDATKIIDKILAIDLLDPSAYYNKAYVFREMGELKSSEQSYFKGLELVEFKSPFYSGLAKTYEALGKTEDALYYWNEAFQEIIEKDLLNESSNIIFSSIFREAKSRLIDFDVYRQDEDHSDAKSFIEFAKVHNHAQAIYEQELPETSPNIMSEADMKQNGLNKLLPGNFFERLMRKSFEKNFNDINQLNKLGITLVHHKMTSLAVRVFERVYQLNQFVTRTSAKLA